MPPDINNVLRVFFAGKSSLGTTNNSFATLGKHANQEGVESNRVRTRGRLSPSKSLGGAFLRFVALFRGSAKALPLVEISPTGGVFDTYSQGD